MRISMAPMSPAAARGGSIASRRASIRCTAASIVPDSAAARLWRSGRRRPGL